VSQGQLLEGENEDNQGFNGGNHDKQKNNLYEGVVGILTLSLQPSL
jgi:hypothetical protein